MTAAYRFKGIGWMAVVVALALGLYLVSLRVAAERKKVDDLDAKIALARRDIRALETEFDTRANLAQLERWNGDTLALAAPSPAQFVADDTRLAALNPGEIGAPTMRTAALVVPAGAGPVAVTPASTVPAAIATPTPSPPIAAPARPSAAVMTAAVAPIAPTGRAAPALARLAQAAQGREAVAKVRPQAVAMLDRKLLSDTTFGDLLSGARAEARRR